MDQALDTSPRSAAPDSDISVHAETYHRFMLGVKWMAIHLAVILTFLLLWFGASAGFLGALIGALFVLAVGIYAMRHGLAHSTERDNPRALQPPDPSAVLTEV